SSTWLITEAAGAGGGARLARSYLAANATTSTARRVATDDALRIAIPFGWAATRRDRAWSQTTLVARTHIVTHVTMPARSLNGMARAPTRPPRSLRPGLGGNGSGVAADRLGKGVVAAEAHEAQQIGLDVAEQRKAAENEPGIELDEAPTGLDLGESGGAGINPADADQRELAFDPHIGLGQHASRQPEQGPARKPARLPR